MKIKQQHYFGITTEEQKLEDFYVSLTSYNPNTKIAKHFHEKPYLCLLVNGLYKEKNYKNSEIIKTGMTLFREANYEHENDFSDHRGVCLNIEINNPEKHELLNNFMPTNIAHQQKGSIDVFKLLHGLKNNVSKDILNIYCYEAIMCHFDFLPIKGKLDWIQLIKEQIRDNPFTSISLVKLSEEFNLHPNYIVRKFKEVTGYKLSDYLNKVRVEESLSKLITSEESLTQIGIASGFYDQSHYTKSFKKHFAVTPKRFKKVLKG